LADGDPSKGNLFFASPLTFAIALRGWARACLGIPGWRDDLETAAATIPTFDPMTFASVTNYMYSSAIQNGVLVPDTAVFRIIEECLTAAEQFGEEIAIDVARLTRAVALVNSTGPEVDDGLDLLEKTRDRGVHERFSLTTVQYADIHLARAKARAGDLDGAIRMASHDVDESFQTGGSIWLAFATNVLVEALLGRGQSRDLVDAERAIDRLAAAPIDPGFVINEIWLLRMNALLAQAEGDENVYRGHRDRYRQRANELGFEGHIAWAAAMD
jgi:adenylate cyclase